jgi:hypothetical protein
LPISCCRSLVAARLRCLVFVQFASFCLFFILMKLVPKARRKALDFRRLLDRQSKTGAEGSTEINLIWDDASWWSRAGLIS